MQLQQLEYVLEVARAGSINAAAKNLYISQPSLSLAIRNLEKELGIELFERSSHGAQLTAAGGEFIGYARRVIEQEQILIDHFKGDDRDRFSISSQHYPFCAQALADLIGAVGGNHYRFHLRECRTSEIIEDVRTRRSDLGIIYMSPFNEKMIASTLDRADLRFEELRTVTTKAVVSAGHPLAQRDTVGIEDLEGYPYMCFEQPDTDPVYFSEEAADTGDHRREIIVTDRATMQEMLGSLQGYTISSGLLVGEMSGDDLVSIPLRPCQEMTIGFVCNGNRPLTPMALRYIGLLREQLG